MDPDRVPGTSRVRFVTAYSYQGTFAGHDSTAVVGRRIGAWFIDLLIYLLLAWLLSLAIPNNGSKSYDLTGSGTTGTEFCDQWNANHNGFCLHFDSNGKTTAFTYETSAYPFVVVFGHMALYALVQGLLGGSLGKLAVGLRVVDSNGDLCGIGRSFIRTFLWVVDAITLALPIVGGVLMLSTKGHRRVGDMAAGTYVVAKSEVGHPVQIPGRTLPAGSYGSVPPRPQAWGQPQPPAWGQPAQPQQGGWSAPVQGDQSAASGSTSASPEGPRWDPDRNTYIQWDAASSAWLEWDDTAKQWTSIST